QDDLDLIVAVLVFGDLLAGDEGAQAARQRIDVHPEIGGGGAGDCEPQLGLRRLEIRVDVDDAVDRPHLVHEGEGVLLELIEIGTLNENAQGVAAASLSAAGGVPGRAQMSVLLVTLIRAPRYFRRVARAWRMTS